MKRVVIAAVLAIIVVYLSFTAGYSMHADTPPTQQDTLSAQDIDVYDLWALTNQDRANAGMHPLALSPELSATANDRCTDMVTANYWTHDPASGKDFRSFLKDNVSFKQAGENLAYGQADSKAVESQWMNSQEHKDNILLADYTDIGIATCKSDNFIGTGKQTIVVAHYTQSK